jgi:ferrochelatase
MGRFRQAVILVNLGSPRSPRIPDVRAYLKEFLCDPSVIDLPACVRHLLVKGIISPLRAPRSARLYEKLHSEQGFPLVYHSLDLEKKVREQLPEDTNLFMSMRYGEPSLKKIVQEVKNAEYDIILVFPLYPQYASSTTGSVLNLISKEFKNSPAFEKTKLLPQFHNETEFIELWQKKISAFNPENYDALVFTYHGIPVRQTRLAHPKQSCEILMCDRSYTTANEHCYYASCHHTTRSISEDLNMRKEMIYTSFQSRFGRKWLEPFTDHILIKLARKGKRKILIASPSFVADCLETTIEIGHEYKALFKKSGGELLTLIPSLNSDDEWTSFIARMASAPYQNGVHLEKYYTWGDQK